MKIKFLIGIFVIVLACFCFSDNDLMSQDRTGFPELVTTDLGTSTLATLSTVSDSLALATLKAAVRDSIYAALSDSLKEGSNKFSFTQYQADPNAATADVEITGLDADDPVFATLNVAPSNGAYILSVVAREDTAQITFSADPAESVSVAIQALLN